MTMTRLSMLLCAGLFAAACQNTPAPIAPDKPTTEAAASGVYDRPGFVVFAKEGRLTVFCGEDKALAGFQQTGDLIQSVTRIGAGPGGMTVRAPDGETIDGYVLARPGFITRVAEGRIWVFPAAGDDFAKFCAHGEPTQSVTRIGVGPNGETVKSSDGAVIDAWLKALR
jgi:hypothetical protein